MSESSAESAHLTEVEVDVLAHWVHPAALGFLCSAVERIITERQAATADRLGAAMQEIDDEAVSGDFKVGAAYALGVLASLGQAAPGSTWRDVAAALVTPPATDVQP